jgi:hypothetical protein
LQSFVSANRSRFPWNISSLSFFTMYLASWRSDSIMWTLPPSVAYLMMFWSEQLSCSLIFHSTAALINWLLITVRPILKCYFAHSL